MKNKLDVFVCRHVHGEVVRAIGGLGPVFRGHTSVPGLQGLDAERPANPRQPPSPSSWRQEKQNAGCCLELLIKKLLDKTLTSSVMFGCFVETRFIKLRF